MSKDIYPVSVKTVDNKLIITLSNEETLVANLEEYIEKYLLSYNDIYELCIKAYKAGYSNHDIVEAGLESNDPDTEVRYILLDIKDKIK